MPSFAGAALERLAPFVRLCTQYLLSTCQIELVARLRIEFVPRTIETWCSAMQVCRWHGIDHLPYRKLSSLAKLVIKTQTHLAATPAQREKVLAKLETLNVYSEGVKFAL